MSEPLARLYDLALRALDDHERSAAASVPSSRPPRSA
jgi:hypothetical protein